MYVSMYVLRLDYIFSTGCVKNGMKYSDDQNFVKIKVCVRYLVEI